MEPVVKQDKLVVIVGPTASGKSSAALEMAEERGGEIIAADSRTIYKGMDIGTAKPTAAERMLVPHHLIDIIEPGESFSVADFKKLANAVIEDIQSRGKLPILVGGTGLYIDAVIYDYAFRKTDPKIRAELNKLDVKELQKRIKQAGLELPANLNNPRHLVRMLETNGQASKKQSLRDNTLVLGIDWPTDVLKQRITDRVERMFTQGLEAEVKILVKKYGWDCEAMKGVGYKEWQAYFTGDQTLEETKQLIQTNTWQYARRQRTWFKKNPDIHWR